MIRRSILILIAFLFVATNLRSSQPYVLLISFDGFRYDYPGLTDTPNIDKIGETGVKSLSLQPVFPSMTFPNHLSIITGLYPENHGIIANYFLDPVSNRQYSLYNQEERDNPFWYAGETFWVTAKRNGIKSAVYFWPGSEINDKTKQPDYFEKYDHDRPYTERIDGIINWLNLPQSDRPHFLSLYFHETDSRGHKYGPDSEEIVSSVVLLDSLMGYLFDRLEEINMRDSINIILLSDHGMAATDSSKLIDINSIIDDTLTKVNNYGTMAMVYPVQYMDDLIYKKLEENNDNFSVYHKDDIPERWHYSNYSMIPPILVVADDGWLIKSNNDRYKGMIKGVHGYDNAWIDMHGIFYATGPAFKSGFKTGTLKNIDIYPLLCEIFNIPQRTNIDGNIERIEFLLKNK